MEQFRETRHLDSRIIWISVNADSSVVALNASVLARWFTGTDARNSAVQFRHQMRQRGLALIPIHPERLQPVVTALRSDH